jgi:Protein of unknown function (DUF3562)
VPQPAKSDDAAVAALARQTDTAVDVVRNLYDGEIAALRAQATVTSFIGVIASRRVKQHLLTLGEKQVRTAAL